MTKQEKATAILSAFAEGFRVYAVIGGANVDIFGVAYDGEKIQGFKKVAGTDGVKTFEQVDVTNAETFRYFLEPICGATVENTANATA